MKRSQSWAYATGFNVSTTRLCKTIFWVTRRDSPTALSSTNQNEGYKIRFSHPVASVFLKPKWLRPHGDEYRAVQWLQWFESAVEDRGNIAKERLLATFDVLQNWYADPSFRGCPFINAVLELADAAHPAHQTSVNVRESIRQYVMRLAAEAGVKNPEIFSQQYLLLIGGASLVATIEGNSNGAEHAKNALSVLIEAS